MKTITLAALKGGVGKSTLTINLACACAPPEDVLIIDMDKQGTCRDWACVAAAAGRNTPPVIGMGAEIRRDLQRVARGVSYVFIDTPAQIAMEQRNALMVCDLVLIPVVPGPADIWALQETLALVRDAQGLRPELQARVILNRTIKRTEVASDTLKAIEESEIPICQTILGSRVAYGGAMGTGQGVTTYDGAGKAYSEMVSLTKEVLQVLQVQVIR